MINKNETHTLYIYEMTAFQTEDEVRFGMFDIKPWLTDDQASEEEYYEIEVTKEEWKPCEIPERWVKELM